ncbi:MAG TPA: hypothetical protein VFI34_04220 [Candidatus Limnocylindrales bacterium]|nr:hypothetical protein [Candidatus Limnocylindrales bacterium]
MNPTVAALAVATLAGGVLAVSSRDVRSVVLGLLIVLAGAPLVADPWPGPLAALVRIAGALLAVRLIVVGVRGLGPTAGSRIGWPAASVLAAAGLVAGVASHGLGATALGPAAAQAAGFGLIVLALAPLVIGRDVLRLGVGAVLLLSGAQLVRVALDPAPTDADQLVAALLAVGLGGAVAVIVAAAGAAGGLDAGGGLAGDRGPRPPDAHRIERPAARRQAADAVVEAPVSPARRRAPKPIEDPGAPPRPPGPPRPRRPRPAPGPRP